MIRVIHDFKARYSRFLSLICRQTELMEGSENYNTCLHQTQTEHLGNSNDDVMKTGLSEKRQLEEEGEGKDEGHKDKKIKIDHQDSKVSIHEHDQKKQKRGD